MVNITDKMFAYPTNVNIDVLYMILSKAKLIINTNLHLHKLIITNRKEFTSVYFNNYHITE